MTTTNPVTINNRIDMPLDEIEVGTVFRSGGRTITETDVVNYCALTGNWIEIHSNVHYAAQTRFGERLVQGSLTYSIMTGLITFGPPIQANYGINNLRYLTPVHINDTIYVTAEVLAKKDKDDKYGVITLLMKALNQNGDVCQKSEWSLLMLRKREDLEALVGASLPTERAKN
ncbi:MULTISPECIES: MaoC/PaaZ C-terminal domain-containing protein [Rhodococcus]|uniref:Dehydratase n=1 Tax=Rhodococcus opacus TaxID=37919 RepID=A0A076EXP1_RHOOP|nr:MULTISPECIES: MaoC/PaaZ C-terminal domain-containing protein [Rhodococcus]AII08119.1 dehydratase [Rhodococcus opacus]QSE80518.1 dehydratase [Rhodococcus koreensis]WAM12319.1 MaoC/PaaZ C-terminal domain-containing protein [Rhodococcus sp. JS3073]